MNIFEALKNGKTQESIMAEFTEDLAKAMIDYEKYLQEKAEAEERIRKAREAEEYARQAKAEARTALGAAILEYITTLDIKVTESTYDEINGVITAIENIFLRRVNEKVVWKVW